MLRAGGRIKGKDLEIVEKKLKDLIPYKTNPRKNDKSIEKVANSIKEFGFKVPIVIDKDNVIVCGHTRYQASKRLHLKDVPCVIADDLTEEQIRAFRLADNKVSEFSEWDEGLLGFELSEIKGLNMENFGFDISFGDIVLPEQEEDTSGYYGDERERTNNFYNLDLVSAVELTKDFWQMPIIENDHVIPKDVIGFNYAKTSQNKNVGIHFYVDDYQFERIWSNPDGYIDTLLEYDCILSPDFSLYMDMTMPTKIWNVYRSRLIGAYYQAMGIKVIPTVSWAEKETFDFCFKGIPKGSIVSVSTIGVKKDKNALQIWREGMQEMIRQIEPSTILVYGGELDFDYGDIKVIYFENHVTKNWSGK